MIEVFNFPLLNLMNLLKNKTEMYPDVHRRKVAITNSMHLFYTARMSILPMKFGLSLRQKKSNFFANPYQK